MRALEYRLRSHQRVRLLNLKPAVKTSIIKPVRNLKGTERTVERIVERGRSTTATPGLPLGPDRHLIGEEGLPLLQGSGLEDLHVGAREGDLTPGRSTETRATPEAPTIGEEGAEVDLTEGDPHQGDPLAAEDLTQGDQNPGPSP